MAKIRYRDLKNVQEVREGFETRSDELTTQDVIGRLHDLPRLTKKYFVPDAADILCVELERTLNTDPTWQKARGVLMFYVDAAYGRALKDPKWFNRDSGVMNLIHALTYDPPSEWISHINDDERERIARLIHRYIMDDREYQEEAALQDLSTTIPPLPDELSKYAERLRATISRAFVALGGSGYDHIVTFKLTGAAQILRRKAELDGQRSLDEALRKGDRAATAYICLRRQQAHGRRFVQEASE